MMKNFVVSGYSLIIFSLMISFFAMPAFAQAPNNPTGAPNNPTNVNGDVIFENPIQPDTVEDALGAVLGAIRGIIAVLAILFIVIGGVLYITSAGNSSRIELAKNAIWAAVIGLALAVIAPSLLFEIYNVLGTPADNPLPADTKSVQDIVLSTLELLLRIIGVLAIIMLVVGGILYITSAGDSTRTEAAKKTVFYAIIGLIVALVSLVIVSQVVNTLGAG